jgi:hypothetical protein
MAAKVCCVLASDEQFFYQVEACLGTLEQFLRADHIDFKLISLGLTADQTQRLSDRGMDVWTDLKPFPRYTDAPLHTVALTCRPYLPEVFPGYDTYVWIDSDLRFLDPSALSYYIENSLNDSISIVIAHETEPTYTFNSDPVVASWYHRSKNGRNLEAFGIEAAKYLEFYNVHNAGLFAARADSPLWARYKRNLDRTLNLPFHPLREQDAMNVSLVEVRNIVQAPSTLNWLCTFSIPVPSPNGNGWVSPRDSGSRIAVVHLTNSTDPITINNQQMTRYDYYRALGLTQ